MKTNTCLHNRRFWVTAFLPAFVLTAFTVAQSQAINVSTRNYNNQRTGANLSEIFLTTSNVNSSQFGKLFQNQVDDQVYAGLQYAAGLSIGGATRNVLYVATVNNTVYAFDADAAGAPLWQRNFNGSGRPTRNTEVGQTCGTYRDFSGNIGIIGTPVIDESTNIMYFVTRTVEGSSTVQRLRAINTRTGGDRMSAVVISASSFSYSLNNQRPALALVNNTIYIGWSSFCDTGSYHGFLLAYDASTLQQVGSFNVLTFTSADEDDTPPKADITLDIELLAIIKAPPTHADLKAPPKMAVKTDSGLAFRTLEKGAGTRHPSSTSQVKLHLSGWTTDGALFESTVRGGKPAVYIVAHLVPGLHEGVLGMVVGEKRRFWIPAALAYGEKRGRRGVPTGNLVYDVKLLAIE